MKCSSSSTLVVLIAFLGSSQLPEQSPFQTPTKCGPVATVVRPPRGGALSGPEARGSSRDATIWALFFHHPIAAHHDVKIVWRVTGTGTFQVKGYQPGGAITLPTHGPTEHGGSNWDKPGDEWGTWFSFPAAGCWDLHVTRGRSSGDLWIEVK